MCATSGGGFALMTEAIGQAGMIEVRWLLSRYNVVVPHRHSHKDGAGGPQPSIRRITGRFSPHHQPPVIPRLLPDSS